MTVSAARSKGLLGVTGEVTKVTGGEVKEVTGGKEFPQGPSWVCNAGSGRVTGVAAGVVFDRVVTHSGARFSRALAAKAQQAWTEQGCLLQSASALATEYTCSAACTQMCSCSRAVAFEQTQRMLPAAVDLRSNVSSCCSTRSALSTPTYLHSLSSA